MSKQAQRNPRTPQQIGIDFSSVIRSGVPLDVARTKFEVLWDETNHAVMPLLGTSEGDAYLRLMRRMQEAFDLWCRPGTDRNTRRGP